jgi:hypothetical protein
MLLTDGEPETPEDFEAVQRFGEQEIAQIERALGAVSEDAKQQLPLLIRQWAVLIIKGRGSLEPIPPDKATPKKQRDCLNDLSKKLSAASLKIYNLPSSVDERLIDELGNCRDKNGELKPDAWIGYSRASDWLDNLAAKKIEVPRGAPPKHELRKAARELASIYHCLTGQCPTISYNSYKEWRETFEERFAVAMIDGEQPEPEARRIAFASCLARWLDMHPATSEPDRCAWCGKAETPGNVVPFSAEPAGHVWLHHRCWQPWFAQRQEQAAAALASLGVADG